ncbi:Na+/H+ antiporter NhaC family protein [Intestinimonas timonensis]|uniref:Na+/H+ antiporter NhaC family protein n=1 Tax=Intestinimonas timonensis TaxID=1689270 RepID=UPI003A8F9DA0
MQGTKRRIIPFILALAAITGLLMTTAFAEGEAEYVSSFFAQPLSLLPPVLAIALALITKEVYTSLFLGCLVGGFLYANFNPVMAVTSVYDMIAAKVGDNMGIVVFLVSLGFIVVLMNRSGGSKAYGDWAKKVIKTRRGALLATMILAIVLGVDDYFNNLTTGNVMRPVTDGHQISRAKLAYMIDSTAAPVCIMMPISSWAAAVSGVAEQVGVSGLQLFISAIPWNYYAVLTIFTLIILAVFDIDFGPMKVHEDNAKRGDIYTTPERPYADADDESKNSTNGKVIDLIIPVVVLIVSCVSGLLYTGGFFTPDSGTYLNVMDAFANCTAATGLMYGSFIVVIFCFLYFLILRRSMSFVQVTDCIAEGFKVMVPAILILTFAWTISGVTNDLLGANVFVEQAMESSAESLANFLPAVIFVVACGLGFATGTSWGTFGILIPIVVSVFGTDAGTILTVGLGACLGGAVMGDHCSPISDTTILASTGAQCYHINHVNTQIPYAVTVAAVAFVNHILAGLIQNVIINFVIALASMFAVLMIIRAVTSKKSAPVASK